MPGFGPTNQQATDPSTNPLLLLLKAITGGTGVVPQTQAIRLPAINVSMSPAQRLASDPFVHDTLSTLFSGNKPQFYDRKLPGTGTSSVFWSDPNRVAVDFGGGFAAEGEQSPQQVATHELGHVLEFTRQAPELIEAVQRKQPANSIQDKDPHEYFADTFLEAWDYVRGTGVYNMPANAVWTGKEWRVPEGHRPKDWSVSYLEKYSPGIADIIDWLAAHGYKRKPLNK